MLSNLIRQHALLAAQAGNWLSVASTLNDLTRTITDHTHWSFGLMMSQGQLPEQLVVGVAAAVKTDAQINPLMESAFIAFSTTGLQLHTPERQAMIDAIGAGLPAEAVAAVKSLGVRVVPFLKSPVTAEQCHAAWDADVAQQTAQQAAVVRSARVASLQKLDAESIVDGSSDLDGAIASIRASLVSFGGW